MADPELGLKVFSPPGGSWESWTASHGPTSVDVVMVHGLNGGRLTTWTRDDVCWPQDLLYEKIPTLRVMTFGYNANFLFSSSTSQIRDFSLKLLTDLRDKRYSTEEKKRPIIFICHSLGGIVAKKALVIANLNSEYRTISSSTVGIVSLRSRPSPAGKSNSLGMIFFGTPHFGASVATVGKIISKATGFAGSRADLLAALEKNDKGLQGIAEDFKCVCTNYSIKSFYESDRLLGVTKVVAKHSATMNTPQEESIPMDGDHREICRFSRYDERFEAVWKAVSRLATIKAPSSSEGLNLRLTEVERKVIEGLPGHDIGSFLDSQEQPHSNSCNWIPENECFRKFLSSSHTHILHIVGEPGSGKSTAAAWLFRTSRSWGPDLTPLLFSFHSKSRASAAWSSLLYQLLHLDGTSTAAVHGALEDEDQSSRWKSEHSSSDPWTSSRLRDVFKSVVGRFPDAFQTLYIIDALDECDDTLSGFLGSVVDILQARPSSRVKFLFLSRRILSSSMDSLFEPVGGTFRIIMNENTAHVENVQRYIQTKVDDLCKSRPGLSHLRSEIVEELEQRSFGIYLFASLNLKSLATAKATPLNIRSVIRTLPGDLKAIYSQALDKVAPADQLRAAALLLWVVFAVRPLREWELSAAVAVTCLDFPITSDSDLKDQVSLDILGETGIHELVGPLIRVTGGDVVSLVHSSARQYLISLAPIPSRYNDPGSHNWVWGWVRDSKGWEFDSTAAMASHMLSLNCRDLISFASRANISASIPESTSINSPDTGIRSLLHYAIENLPDHVRQTPPGHETHAVFASFLKSDDGKAWMRQFWMLKDPTQPYKLFSPLELCCALGLVETVKQLLSSEKYPRVKLWDVQEVKRAKADATELLTAADLAAMFGNVEILRVLCEDMGTPADSDDLIPQISRKGTTSDEVVANERERAVEQLSWYRPLHTATTYGHAKVVEYLISRGASISRQDESKKWVIEIAMDNRVEGLIRLLLHHHQDDIPQLLHRFVEVGNPNNIERLLKLHPELLSNGVHFKTILGEHDGSILHVAASAGRLSVYKLLIRLGADYGIKDSEGRQAIHYAAASGQTAFIESLLTHGMASRNDEDGSGRNPLFYAALGASCCDDERWTPVPEREQVFPALFGNISTAVSNSFVSSALRSLSKFSYYASGRLAAEEDSSARDFEEWKFDECLRTLLSMASDITLDDGFLHAAFESTFFPLGTALALAPNVNKADSRGRTALHVAAAGKREWGSWHRWLAERVANIDQRDVDGMTALRLAIDSAEQPEIRPYYVLPKIKVLVDRGADPTCVDILGVMPISTAAEFLLTAPDPRRHRGAPRAVDDGLLTSLLWRSNVAEGISDEVLPRLMAALALSGRQKDLTSLIKAISTRQKSHWLEHGLDTVPMTAGVLFTCHELGWLPEALSAMAPHLDNEQLEQTCARALLEKTRSIAEICLPHLEDHDHAWWLDRQDCRGHLINAAQRGDKDTIELFLEIMNGDVDVKDEAGQTMLSHAAETGQVGLTKYFLSRGADSSVRDAEGRSAVYWAAREGKLGTLKLLVEADTPVTEKDVGIATSMGRELCGPILMNI